jgi:hypothetical protein
MADLTVVGHMGVSHEEIAIADDGLSPTLDCATMERDEFPYDIIIPNDERGLLSLIGNGLGGLSNGGELKDLASFPNRRSLPNDHMRADLRSLSNEDIFSDD